MKLCTGKKCRRLINENYSLCKYCRVTESLRIAKLLSRKVRA